MKRKIFLMFSAGVLGLCACSGIIASLLTPYKGDTSLVDPKDPKFTNLYKNAPSESIASYLESSNASYEDILYFGNYNFRYGKHISTTSLGNVEASVAGIPYDQQVKTRRTINEEDTFFETNTISAFVKKSEQRYTNPNSYLVREGKNPSIDGADYSSSSVSALTKEAYYTRYGHDNRDVFNYIINDYTVLTSSFDGNKDGLYYFSYTLDPDISSSLYKQEVSYMGGASSFPTFNAVYLKIAVNDKYQIVESETSDEYKMPIMGGLTCKGSYKENITYSDNYIECEEKSAFEPFFGQSGIDVEKELSAFEYLQKYFSSLMETKQELNLAGNITIDEENLKTNINLDINSLNLKINLDDELSIYYSDSNAYILTNSSAFLIDKNQISTILGMLDTSIDPSNLSSLLENPFISNMIVNMTVSKNDSYVDINIPMDNSSYVTFNFLEGENKDLTLLGIKGNAFYQGHDFKLDLTTSSKYEYKEIPTDIKQITNLEKLATNIDNIKKDGGISGDFTYDNVFNVLNKELKVSLDGSFVLNFKDEKNVLGNLNIIANINDQEINLNVSLENDDIYIYYNDNLKIKTNIGEIKEILNQYLPNVSSNIPNFSIKEGLGLILNLLDNIQTYQDKITFNLESLNMPLLNSTLSIDYSSSLKVSYDNLKVNLVNSTTIPTINKFDDGISLTTLNNIYTKLSEYKDGNISLNLNGFTYNNLYLDGNIDLQLDYSSLLDSNVYGKLNIIYKNYKTAVEFYYASRKVYVKLNEKSKFALDETKFEEVLKQFIPDFNFERNLTSFDFSLNIKNILDSIKITDNDIELDFTNFTNLPFEANYILKDNSLNIVSKENGNILATRLTKNIEFDTSSYVDLSSKVTDFSSLIKSILDNKSLSSEFSFIYDKYTFKGSLSYKQVSENKYNLYVNLTSPISLNVIFDGEYFYVQIENSYVKFNANFINNSLSLLSKYLNIDESSLENILNIIKGGINSINNVSTTFEDKVIDFSLLINSVTDKQIILDLSQINEKLSATTINLDTKEISLLFNDEKLNSLNLSNIISSSNISIPEVSNKEKYLDVSILFSLKDISFIEKLLKVKTYNLEISNFTYQDFVISGNVYIDISNLNFENINSLTLEDLISLSVIKASLNVTYKDEIYALEVVIFENKIQVMIDNNTNFVIEANYNELVSLISKINEIFKTDISLPQELISSNIDIISLIKNYSINELISSLSFENNVLSLDLNLPNLDLMKISINLNEEYVKVISSQYGTIKLNLANKIEDPSSNLALKGNVSVSELIKNIDLLNNALKNQVFSGDLGLSNLNIKLETLLEMFNIDMSKIPDDLKALVSDVNVSYQIDMRNKFDFYMDISLTLRKYDESSSKLNVYIEHLIMVKNGKDIYFKLSNIVSKLTYEEWLEVVYDISTNVFDASTSKMMDLKNNVLKYSSQLDLGLESFISYMNSLNSSTSNEEIINLFNYKDIISSLNYSSGKLSLNINLTKLLNHFNVPIIERGNLTIEVVSNDEKVNFDGIAFGNIKVNNAAEINLIKPIESSYYVDYKIMQAISNNLKSIKNYLNSNIIKISTNNSGLNAVKDNLGNTLYTYSGDIVIDKTDKMIVQANNIALRKFTNNEQSSYNEVSFKYAHNKRINDTVTLEDTLLASYRSSEKNSPLNFYIDRVNLATSIKYLFSMLQINSETLSAILDSFGANGEIDSSILDKVANVKLPDISLNLTNLIKEISKENLSNNKLTIKLNAEDIYKSLYGDKFNQNNTLENKNEIVLILDSNNTTLSSLVLQNMYSKKEEAFNIDLNLSNVIDENTTSLEDVVDVTSAYNINNLPLLLDAFNNTANLKNYHISGNVSLNILGEINVAYEIFIVLDENKSPIVGVKINTTSTSVTKLAISGGTSYLYYVPETNNVYFHSIPRNKYVTYSNDPNSDNYAGKANNTSQLVIDILNTNTSWTSFGAGKLTENSIRSSIQNFNPQIIIETFIKNYSYNDKLVNLSLDGTLVMSSLSNIDVKLKASALENIIIPNTDKTITGDFLTNFDFTTSMSVISINGYGEFNDIGSDFSKIVEYANYAKDNPNGKWTYWNTENIK